LDSADAWLRLASALAAKVMFPARVNPPNELAQEIDANPNCEWQIDE
jgi:hypothetical protein